MPTRCRITLTFVMLLALTAACSADADGPTARPSSAFPSPTSSPQATTPGPSGPSATTGPTVPPLEGTLRRGELSFQLSGDLEIERTLTRLIGGSLSPPPGSFALVWTAAETEATVVGIGGASFTGTEPTSPALSLTLTVQSDDGIASFRSIRGECEVTFDVAEEDAVVGGFTCGGLVGETGETVDASASFSASDRR
jgi:hypothetical protein